MDVDPIAPAPVLNKRKRSGGRGRSNRGTDFKSHKNSSFQQELNDGIRQKLKILSLPPLLTAGTYRATRPQAFNVSLNGLPSAITVFLNQIQAMGSSTVNRLSNDPWNARVFTTYAYAFATAKVIQSQRIAECAGIVREQMSEFTTDVLDQLSALAAQVPRFLAIILDNLGVVTLNQTLVPVLKQSFTAIQTFIVNDQDWNQPEVVEFWNTIRQLFGYGDEDAVVNDNVLICSNPLRLLWNLDSTCADQLTQLLGSWSTVRGVMVPVNLKTGKGSASQLVRFPGLPVRGMLEWYCNADVSDDDIRIAALGLVGHEHGTTPRSFYETSVERCLCHGRINRDDVLYSVSMYTGD